MMVILKQGGLKTGGVNFDAKVRRGSFDVEDLFHAHIGGMDAFARGLKTAYRILEDGVVGDFVKRRYGGWRRGMGRKILKGEATFDDMEAHVHKHGEAEKISGREEWLENVINGYL
jgi:xylose isomerase